MQHRVFAQNLHKITKPNLSIIIISYLVFERPLLQVAFIVTSWQLDPLARGPLCHHEECGCFKKLNLYRDLTETMEQIYSTIDQHALFSHTKAHLYKRKEENLFVSTSASSSLIGQCVEWAGVVEIPVGGTAAVFLKEGNHLPAGLTETKPGV